MKIKVTTLEKKTITLNVDPEMTVQDLLLVLQIETKIPKTQITLKFNNLILNDEKKTLKFHAITEGSDIIMQRKLMVDLDFSGIQIPGQSSKQNTDDHELEEIRKNFLSDPQKLAGLKINNPQLADAIISGDLGKWVLGNENSSRNSKTSKFNNHFQLPAQMSNILKNLREKFDQQNDDYMKMAMADPFDEDAQRMIEEEIKKKNIEQNITHAIEFAPEMFGDVCMLYIDCKVNRTIFNAFVDSGAQTTMMSSRAAKKCSIHHLIDQRYRGLARGVGTQRILGKVHMVDMEIGNVFIPTSFTILEDQPMDILLGLDLLKRHQCCIDLKNNQLIIGTTGTATKFLTESEIPKIDDPVIPNDPFTENDVLEVEMMGFQRPLVISALRQFNGAKDLAIAKLVSNKM